MKELRASLNNALTRPQKGSDRAPVAGGKADGRNEGERQATLDAKAAEEGMAAAAT